MDIKNIFNKTIEFTIKRIVELFAILIILFSISIFLSLTSYSPEDPNFVFPKNTEIKNIFGIQGSFISDLLFQSFGLISFLFSFTLFFTGINIFKSKKVLLIIENIFYTILYSIFGSLFFSVFYKNSFWLTINGNGGFLGNFLQNTFLFSFIDINEQISYYLLIFVIIILFLISINFSISSTLNFIKFLFRLIVKRKKEEQVLPNEFTENFSKFEKMKQEFKKIYHFLQMKQITKIYLKNSKSLQSNF